MKFSIVTISFNQAKYLRECIESVLSQNGVDIEYIVVDPGSTDGSREIIESYGDRIVRVFEKDNGPSDGLNKGFSHATGDIFCFVNSDDYLLPDALSSVLDYFISGDDIDVVLGAGRFVDSDGVIIGKATPSKFSAWLYAYGAVTLFQQGAFFRSQIFRKVGGFNSSNKICWDGELFVDFSLFGARFRTLPDMLAVFRMDGSNISSSPIYFEKLKAEHGRIFEKVVGRHAQSKDKIIRYMARFSKLLNLNYIFRRIVNFNLSSPPHVKSLRNQTIKK